MKTIQDKINSGRQYRSMVVEVRESEGNECIVEGYATTFNQPYPLFKDDDYVVEEQISERAFEECDMSDVIMQYDHRGKVFARISNGTLELKVDEKGLFIRADLSGTESGRQLHEEIKGGYTTKMSFGFVVKEDEVTRINGDITRILRTITKIEKLYDVSAVSIPANDFTEISARDFFNGEIEKIKAERLKEVEVKKKLERLKLRLKLMEV